MKVNTVIRRPDGKLILNPLKDAVRDFTLEMFQGAAPTNVVSLAAGARSAPIIITIPAWAHFEALGLMGWAVDTATRLVDRSRFVTMRVEATSRWNPSWDDEHIMANVCGTAQRPFIFPHSCLWLATQTIQITFRNLDVAGVDISVAFPGRAIVLNRAKSKDVDDLVKGVQDEYSGLQLLTSRGGLINSTLLALTNNQLMYVDIGSARHFELHKRNATIQRTAVAALTGSTRIGFRDQDGYEWTNNYRTPADDTQVFGNAQFPHILFEPTLLRRGTFLELNWDNLNAGTNLVAVSLIGRSVGVAYESEQLS